MVVFYSDSLKRPRHGFSGVELAWATSEKPWRMWNDLPLVRLSIVAAQLPCLLHEPLTREQGDAVHNTRQCIVPKKTRVPTPLLKFQLFPEMRPLGCSWPICRPWPHVHK